MDQAESGVVGEEPIEKRPPKIVLYLMELRVPFFTASIVPVLLGTSLAYNATGSWDWTMFWLTMLGMVLIHAGANVANDYFDHLSGTDGANVDFISPFTGGSRMIQRGLLSPREVLFLAVICFSAGSLVGLYIAFKVGWFILLLGVVGVLGGFFYTAPPLNLVSRGVGEPFIALHFGILPVIGAYYVQAGNFSWNVVIMSLPVAFLIAAVLFVNQFQDYKADRAAGKRNWVVRLGRAKSVWVYAMLMTVWAVPVIAGIAMNGYSIMCLLALSPVLIAIKAVMTAVKNYDHPRRLATANGITIMVHLLVGILLSASLIMSA